MIEFLHDKRWEKRNKSSFYWVMLIALKAEVDKLEINKLIMFQLVWIILKTKLDNLDVGKLKTVPVDLKKLSDVVDNEVLKTENSAH